MKTLLTLVLLAAASTAALAGPVPPASGQDDTTAAAPPAQVTATGVVKEVDKGQGTITLEHEAIPAIGWPAMTMPFHATPEVIKQARLGEKVQFTLRPDGRHSLVTGIRPATS